MLRREAEWMGQRFSAIADEDLFPLLNVGSSTAEFRTKVQPYIDQNIFQPLSRRGGKVYHADIKPMDGVDLVGDVTDPAFQSRLAQLQIRSVLMSNLLEHVTDRRTICDCVNKIVPSGGHIFLSGPHRYPYHEDPIDTMFRPSIEQMHNYFPDTTIIDSAIIDAGNWREWDAAERGGRTLGRALVRLMLPFYRPHKWMELARQTPWIFKHITAFALVLRK